MSKRNRGMDSSDTPISQKEAEAMKRTPRATEAEKARERDRSNRAKGAR